MNSVIPGEDGYSTEGANGYGWLSPITSSPTGTSAMTAISRALNPSTARHALVSSNETLANYTQLQALNIYGYPRYVDELPTSTDAAHNLSLSAGGITVTSNPVAGGAVWSLQYNGFEYINSHDYGRLLQTAIFSDPGLSAQSQVYPGQIISCNPTEGGAAGYINNVQYNQGSQILELYNNGNVQTSRCVPLEFTPLDWGGTFDCNPVIWANAVLGKDITLNWNSLGAVAQYASYVYSPTQLTNSSRYTSTQVNACSLFLRANFKVFYFYNGDTGAITQIPTPPNTPNQNAVGVPSATSRGVIAYDPNSGYAIGVYGVQSSSGGSIDAFTIFNLDDGSGTSPSANACYAILPTHAAPIPAGVSQYYSYIACGTLSQVESSLIALHNMGAH